MSSSLDKSLEDLIKSSKNAPGNNAGRGRGRGAGAGPGPTRRFSNRGANRSTPYDKPVQAPDTMWKHDMYTDQVAAFSAPSGGRASAIETGTKLYISNLDYGVSNEDIKELFSEVGDLKRYSIHYDRSGRSKGTAEVVFSRRTDALSAVKRYNGVQLDGKPMKIEIVGTNMVTPAASQPPVVNGLYGQHAKSGGQRTRGAHGQARGGGNGSRGRGRAGGRGGSSSGGRGRSRTEPVSAEDLDADLDKYHSEAMQTN